MVNFGDYSGGSDFWFAFSFAWSNFCGCGSADLQPAFAWFHIGKSLSDSNTNADQRIS